MCHTLSVLLGTNTLKSTKVNVDNVIVVLHNFALCLYSTLQSVFVHGK